MDEFRKQAIVKRVTEHYERNHKAHESRARKAGAGEWEAEINLEWVLLAVKHFNYSCCYCGTPLDECEITFEHPLLIDDGNNNLVVSCRSCNSSHGNRDLRVWMNQKGYSYIEFAQTMLEVAFEIKDGVLRQLALLEGRKTAVDIAREHMADHAEANL